VVSDHYQATSTASPGEKYSLLPSAVQRTITAEGGAAEIKDIGKVVGGGRDVYEVQFRDPGVNPPLYVAEDGALIGASTTVRASVAVGAPGPLGGVVVGAAPLSNLPYPVQTTIREQAPSAVVVDVQARARTVYEISFRDPNLHPRMCIADDGTVIKQ
jgi:hypothetical protein